MNELTQKALDELKQELKNQLNDSSNPTISAIMPEYGELESDYADDIGNQQICRFNRSEKDALEMAQEQLLYGNAKRYFKELFYDGALAIKAEEFLLELAKEIVEC